MADPLDREAAELRMSVLHFSRRLRAERAVEDMNDTQLVVLHFLRMEGRQTLGELARRERVSAPLMNRIANALEEGGYIVRVPDTEDRRRVFAELTERGEAVVAETMRRRDRWLIGVLGRLEPAEREALRRAVGLMWRMSDEL